MTIYREATAAEILASADYLEGRRILFRHGTVESCDVRAESGIRRKHFGRARIQDLGGVPHVRCHGKLEEIAGRGGGY